MDRLSITLPESPKDGHADMAPHVTQRLLREVDLMDRYTQYYRRQFAQAMTQLSGSPDQAGLQCARLCMEALDMVRCTKQQLADALSQSGK